MDWFEETLFVFASLGVIAMIIWVGHLFTDRISIDLMPVACLGVLVGSSTAWIKR